MTALAGVAQWIECQPVNQRVTGSIRSQGTCLGRGSGPQYGARNELVLARAQCLSPMASALVSVLF